MQLVIITDTGIRFFPAAHFRSNSAYRFIYKASSSVWVKDPTQLNTARSSHTAVTVPRALIPKC